MALRIFEPWCMVFGHRRNAASRRSENGNIFAECSICGRAMFRDPVRGQWRAATAQDRHPRGFALTGERPAAPVEETRER